MSSEIVKVDLSNELSAHSTSTYCSVQGDDMKAKAKIFNAANNPDYKVAKFINKVINVSDVLVEQIQLTDEKDPEVKQGAMRVVLIDENGKAYQAVSTGMFNAVKNAIQIFGEPTWNPPLPVEIKQVEVKEGSMLTFEVKL